MIFKETATLWMLKGYQIRDHMGMSIQICKHSHPQSLHSPFLSPSSEISSSSVTSHIIQLAPSLTYILGRSVWSPISLASSFMTWINHWLMTFNHELREKKKNSYQTTHESQIPKKNTMFFLCMKELRRVLRFLVGKIIRQNHITTGDDQVTTAFLFKLDPCVLSKGQGQEQTSGWARQRPRLHFENETFFLGL